MHIMFPDHPASASRSALINMLWFVCVLCLVFPFQALASPSQHAEYVGRHTCIKCHENQHLAWENTHHDKALQHATADTVLGDFDNVTYSAKGVTTRFFEQDGKYLVHTEGPSGKYQDFQVLYAVGIVPLQQYLVALPGGRLQALSVAWDTQKNRWYSLYPDERITPDDWLHWTQGAQNWNMMCADCHSTHVKKNYDTESRQYQTTWAEIDVSCEACHGPAAAHVDWATRKNVTPSSPPPMLNTKGQSAKAEVELCGACHALRTRIGEDVSPSEQLLDSHIPSLLVPEMYHVDGQIKGEAFEYGAFLQSKMYQAGVRCTDCHDPHSLTLKAEGNALCTRCHSASTFDTQKHHHHPPNSAASRCINCHMDGETFMGVDYRRDHSFRVPRPDLSVSLGVPNACQRCHVKESPEWATRWVERHFGKERAPHFATLLAPARERVPGADEPLVNYVTNPAHPPIARATLLTALSRYPSATAGDTVLASLQDNDALMKHTAINLLFAAPDSLKASTMSPYLTDSVTALRMAAANGLAGVSPALLGPAGVDTLNGALGLYQGHLDFHADSPSGQLMRGAFLDRQGKPTLAMSAYQEALRLDEKFTPARINLANLLHAQGKSEEAIKAFQEVIRQQPTFGDAYYSLGLLFAELGRMNESMMALQQAALHLERYPRAHYNLGLVCQKIGKTDCAENALIQAYQLDNNSAEFLRALVLLYRQQNKHQQAITLLKEYLERYPNDSSMNYLMMQERK